MEPNDGDRIAARRYLPHGSEDAVQAFALRQLQSRERLTRLLDFYRRNPSRIARIHVLTALAVTLGRFCGYSETFDAIGVALMPVGEEGVPRTEGWNRYREACQTGRPLAIRDELWMVAHLRDMEGVRSAGLDDAFYREVELHRDDPTWSLLEQHMEMTLGARLLDHSALAGAIPHETAIAAGMATALGRIFRAGWRLVCRYAVESLRALVTPQRETEGGLTSYRHQASLLAVYTIYAWTAAPVYRRGIRTRERGLVANDDAWPLIAQVLGEERVSSVHPAIARFYSNPSRYHVRAQLKLHTVPARFWSWAATFLIGQGLYETPPGEFDARFRVFRRRDGSMHFVRELYIADRLRVFDSDFVVKEADGRPTLFEVFVDHRIEVRMVVDVTSGGGLRIRGEQVRMRGARLPLFGLRVVFDSRVENDELRIDGALLMEPRTRVGAFLAHRVLRRPRELGEIRYRLSADPSRREP